MPVNHTPNPSEYIEPRPNDQKLQKNWTAIARIIPRDSLPVSFFPVQPRLFRSNLPFPQQLGALYELGIRHIIALTECRALYQQAERLGELPDDMIVHHNPYNQRHFLTLTELIKLCELIHTCQQTGWVLVHCIAGMTRTGLVISAYVAAILGHEPIDNFSGGIGMRHFLHRGYDFITASGWLTHSEHRHAMLARFAAIQVLAQEYNMAIPKFLRPHTGTVNINALKELVSFWDLPDIIPQVTSRGQFSLLPTWLQHTQTVLPGRSLHSEIPSKGGLLPT